MTELAQRTALVTGAARGIGQAIATRLSHAGARVVVVDIDGASAAQVAESLDGPALAYELDIMRGGIDSALLGLGRSSVHDLTPGDIVIPPGFTRTLGA